MKVGFDFGSKNISAVLIENNELIQSYYAPHNGNLVKGLREITQAIKTSYGENPLKSCGICGSVDISHLKPIDSVLAAVEANKFLNTGCQNILSVGCESFSLIILDEDYNYIEHSTNPMCASGTGSFIDQQAERMGMSTEELAEIAAVFQGKTPSIATRCAVFAKSDIIHAQANGFSKEAIACGLCEGMSLSILANLLKGRSLQGDVLFTGGVSQNTKILQEISRLLDKQIKIINHSPVFNAIGAALLGTSQLEDIERSLTTISKEREKREKLIIDLPNYPDFPEDNTYTVDDVEITEYLLLDKQHYDVYIGLDIGSTSTKAIITDQDSQILAGFYTKTAGAPVAAVQKIFHQIQTLFAHADLHILGIGTTGSGRKLIKEILNADFVINEITAHARGALFLDPDVDTIIEIGGQDSKFTLLKNGSVIHAAMNYVCAAGTGSFIEEQAKRLDITLDDISGMAVHQEAPFTSDRCTVYMERDLNIFLSEGFSKEQIITAVLYSVRDNYLSKVVGKSALGERIYFQGATGRNKALVAVFQNELKKPVIVSKYCHLTGALGVCVLLKEQGLRESRFNGLDFTFSMSHEVCEFCVNRCDVMVYDVKGKKTAWGFKCGREYEDNRIKKTHITSSLEKDFEEIFENELPQKHNGKTVGIPHSLYLTEYYPLFADLFSRLGFHVVHGFGSDQKLNTGKNLINSDFCVPIVLGHGIVEALNKKEIDYLFLPALINEQSLLDDFPKEEKFIDKIRDGYFCYYSEYMPTIIDNLTGIDLKDRLLSPKIKFNNRSDALISEELAEFLEEKLSLDKERIQNTFLTSLKDFRKKQELWSQKGQHILEEDRDKIKILFLGRPYSVFDPTIHLGIPAKFEEMGFPVLYQSMLPLEEGDGFYATRYLRKMHWYYGQQILLASEIAARSQNIYPVFLSCFRCSPDSYLMTYMKDIMEQYNKPYLIIQLDEHTSDIGYQTRIEAAIETFRTDFQKKKDTLTFRPKGYKNDQMKEEYIVLLPYVSPIISTLQKYAFQANGYQAMILPLDERMINRGYRYASGAECMPNVAILGSLIETLQQKKELIPDKSILYLPTLCMGCNFNQFTILIEAAAEQAGLEGLKICNHNTMRQIPDVPKRLNINLLEMNILGSLISKLYYRFHPYEKIEGAADRALAQSLDLLKEHVLERKSLTDAAKTIRRIFESIELNGADRKPRVAIIGDLYAKYNFVLNQDIYRLIEGLDCEVLIPSFTENVAHFLHADEVENQQHPKYKRGLTLYEKRYEHLFKGLLDDSFEPSLEECVDLIHEYGIQHFIAGETTVSVGRALYMIKHKLVDAFVHVNPVFCCPGVVSSSIFRKIQEDFGVPIIDLFYDGTNKPNSKIIPQLYYLKNTSVHDKK